MRARVCVFTKGGDGSWLSPVDGSVSMHACMCIYGSRTDSTSHSTSGALPDTHTHLYTPESRLNSLSTGLWVWRHSLSSDITLPLLTAAMVDSATSGRLKFTLPATRQEGRSQVKSKQPSQPRNMYRRLDRMTHNSPPAVTEGQQLHTVTSTWHLLRALARNEATDV